MIQLPLNDWIYQLGTKSSTYNLQGTFHVSHNKYGFQTTCDLILTFSFVSAWLRHLPLLSLRVHMQNYVGLTGLLNFCYPLYVYCCTVIGFSCL
jgi:hypothetical protein